MSSQRQLLRSAAPTPAALRPVRRVLIVDDHHAFADLLAMALANEADFEIAGTAGTAEAALETAARTRPDVVVMDIQLGGQDGIAATRRIRDLLPDVVVVVISALREQGLIVRAATAGASGFAPKTGSLSEILWVLRNAHNGSMVVSPSEPRQRVSLETSTSSAPVGRFTAREREVLALMGKGVAPAQIARALFISVHTSRGYVKSIHAKLGARSQLEAVVKAQQLGLIDVDETAPQEPQPRSALRIGS